MLSWFREVDRVLRGDATRVESLREGVVSVSGRRLLVANVVLAMIYGACMGVFALFNREIPDARFMLAGLIKVPALFFFTLAVTFPSLYVFNALVGSRLSIITLGRLMMATLGITTALLASFGPIVAFFSITTTSYPFMILLNVAVCGLAGLLGLRFLFQSMHRLTALMAFASAPQALPANPPGEGDDNVALTQPPRVLPLEPVGQVRTVFVIWMLVFGLVGAQMSWILRPFLGRPDLEFAWFRPRSSNFFESVINQLRSLFGS